MAGRNGEPTRDGWQGIWRSARRGIWLPFLLVAATLLALRLPLWRLPGPGRDEAAYHYWAHHFEPAFAPLLQLAVRVFEVPFGHSLWALRGPVILLGALVLWLQDLRMQRADASRPARLLALLIVATTPWQSFSGAILHPDNFLLASLLALTLAARDGRLLLTATAGALAALSKPTGVLILPVVWWLLGRLGTTSGGSRGQIRPLIGRAILLLASLPLLVTIDSGLLAGIADFGRISPDVSLWGTAGAWGLNFFFLAGFLLPWYAVVGFAQRVRLLRSGGASSPVRRSSDAERREAVSSLAIALVLLGFFLAAALMRGQFKANWILPAAVLLLPLGPTRLPRGLLIGGIAFTLCCSAGQTVLLTHPNLLGRDLADGAERTYDYSRHATVREARVSPTRTWRDRFSEYQGCAELARSLEGAWGTGSGGRGPLRWIVSDDYGLAMQMHWYLGHDTVRVALPGDGVFRRTVRDLLREDAPGTLLLVPVLGIAEQLDVDESDGSEDLGADGADGRPEDLGANEVRPRRLRLGDPEGRTAVLHLDLGAELGSFPHPITEQALAPWTAELTRRNHP